MEAELAKDERGTRRQAAPVSGEEIEQGAHQPREEDLAVGGDAPDDLDSKMCELEGWREWERRREAGREEYEKEG